MYQAFFPSATLAEFFRYALLLTGHARTAEALLVELLAEAEGPLAQLRNETSRRAWLAGKMRERCLANQGAVPAAAPRLIREEAEPGGPKPAVLGIEAFLLAQRFHALPEPERSALALFYLEIFEVEELAQFLQMDLEVLSETLGAARELLQQALHGTPPMPA